MIGCVKEIAANRNLKLDGDETETGQEEETEQKTEAAPTAS